MFRPYATSFLDLGFDADVDHPKDGRMSSVFEQGVAECRDHHIEIVRNEHPGA